MRRVITLFATTLVALLTVVNGAPARAAAVVIWPVDPTIGATERSAALWLENRGRDTVTLQIRSLSWSQSGGGEGYADQDEVVASPPIADVPPGKRQLVRVLRRATTPAKGEHAYRLMIDEIPTADTSGGDGAKLAVQLRYSIPLFTFGEPDKLAPRLSGRIVIVEGKPFAEIHNGGAGHARLTDLRISGEGGERMLAQGLVGYVLPGATMRWPLSAQVAPRGALRVGVNGSDQTLGATL